MTEWLERNGFIPILTPSLTDDEIEVLKSILGEPLEERAMRLIDADLIQYEPMLSAKGNGMYEDVMVAYKSQINDLPTIERKTGKWIYGEDEYGIDGYHCDKCGFFVPWDYTHKFINYIEDYNFCPSCGADMRGET